MMSDIAKLRRDLAQLDLLIQTHSQILEQMLRQRSGLQTDGALTYPTSLIEMRTADEGLRMLYSASAKLRELCWQREIKKEILRMTEGEATSSPHALAM
jgi:hypothetical protein